jgi:hypothetical protein
MNIEDVFKNAKPGVPFAKGSAPDSPGGLHMTGSGRTLYWVAVKGHANDWAVYCGWIDNVALLMESGDKVHGDDNITNITHADKQMMTRYRH